MRIKRPILISGVFVVAFVILLYFNNIRRDLDINKDFNNIISNETPNNKTSHR